MVIPPWGEPYDFKFSQERGSSKPAFDSLYALVSHVVLAEEMHFHASVQAETILKKH